MKIGDNVRVICKESPHYRSTGKLVEISHLTYVVELEHTPGAALSFLFDEIEACPLLDMFDELVALRDNPAALNKRAEEMMNEFISDLPDDQKRKAKQFNWTLQGKLRKVPEAQRYNEMVKLFWEGVNKFSDTLGGGK